MRSSAVTSPPCGDGSTRRSPPTRRQRGSPRSAPRRTPALGLRSCAGSGPPTPCGSTRRPCGSGRGTWRRCSAGRRPSWRSAAGPMPPTPSTALADLYASSGKLADAVDAARRGLELAEGRHRRRTLEVLIERLRASEPGEPDRLALERALSVLDGPALPPRHRVAPAVEVASVETPMPAPGPMPAPSPMPAPGPTMSRMLPVTAQPRQRRRPNPSPSRSRNSSRNSSPNSNRSRNRSQ